MNLNGPGTSLFQGNELSSFNSISEGEEEEAIEEQRKRDLELKNMLENAFDDVSFDNDEGSICNFSQNQSQASHSAFRNGSDFEVFKEVSQNKSITDFENRSNNFTQNTPLKKATKNSLMNRIDFNSDNETYSDQCRKKIQNGSLHDVVDASGGGGDGDIQSSLHFNHCIKRSPIGDMLCNGISDGTIDKNLEFTDGAYDSSEQLKILYDVRVREVHRLTELVDSIRNEHELEIKDLKHQMALILAEKERVNISHSQLQNLLVSSKQETEELANEVAILKKANKELEAKNNDITVDLETSKLTVDNLQRKVLILEKGSKDKSELVQYEMNMKSLTEKHNIELENLKKELDKYIRNYELLLKENEELKLKVSNISQINDENLAKKSEIINRLSKQVDETQKQCESLLKLSTSEDNIRLQTELKILKEEKSILMAKIESLEKENTRKEEELKQFESFEEILSFSENHSDSKNIEGSNVSGKLRDELCRSLKGLKLKRKEINNLEAQLVDKNEKIMQMTENEVIMRKEIVKLKDENEKLLEQIQAQHDLLSKKDSENNELKNSVEKLKKEMDCIDGKVEGSCKELEKENEILKNKIICLEKEKVEVMNSYNEEYMRFHNNSLERVREETEKHFKLEILKKDLEVENLKKEIEDVKNLYVEVYNTKENLLIQIEREKNSSRGSIVDVEEVKRLQKELDKSRQRILELDQTLKQQYQQEVEILNLDINHLNLQIEKMKKEKDLELAEKDKISVENELLKSEIEQITSQKNLYFLKCDKLEKDIKMFYEESYKTEEKLKKQIKELAEKHELEMQNLSSKYEIKIKKLKKEVEITLKKNTSYESKETSPLRNSFSITRNVAVQGSPVSVNSQSTSPLHLFSTKEVSTSPITEIKNCRKAILKQSLCLRDIGVLTDPEPQRMSKKEVVEIMEKLGHHHEEEMRALENKYHVELMKLDKKFQMEVDKAKELIERELKKEHREFIEELQQRHKIEMENRIQQEKKEAVVDLITEWACEVQGLKVAYAEAQADMEKMKLKYRSAKSQALQYKTYFKSKTDDMKEEWRRIEDGYERALRELEKNVNVLVDVKEDEVKAKVESITKIYEQKINKMKEKLLKFDNKLRAGKIKSVKGADNGNIDDKFQLKKELEKLAVPHGNLYNKPIFNEQKKTKSSESPSKKREMAVESKVDAQNSNYEENLKSDRDVKNR